MDTGQNIHFRILEDIAKDLSGEMNFPTSLDAAIMVRNTLKSPEVTLDQVARAVGLEPLIASKLLRLANSVAYNPTGKSITDLKSAIGRLGFESVRTTSLAVAMDQIMKSKHLADFDFFAKRTWEHSLQTAAISRVLSRRLGRGNPDEAMLAGLVHDIGIFYLLYRAAEYTEYHDNKDAILELVLGWHESIGESLLHILGLPDRIIVAVRDHDHLRNVETPCNLSDILYFANLLAGGKFEWLTDIADPEESAAVADARERFGALLEEAEEDIVELRAALAA
ncbi:MAG: putative signal transduction protein [Proteobacteria bacterium]|nr:putative signal transduction protein [Pseudomonadota bacterium]